MQARGTILQHLKARGWADELSAGIDRRNGGDCNSVVSALSVAIDVTEAGALAWREGAGVVCSYVTHVLCGGIAVGSMSQQQQKQQHAQPMEVEDTAAPANAATSAVVASTAVAPARAGSKRRRGASTSSAGSSRGGDSNSSSSNASRNRSDNSADGSSIPDFPLTCTGLATITGATVTADTLSALYAHAQTLRWVHEEAAQLEAVDYHFGDDDSEPLERVTGIATAMVSGASDGLILPAASGQCGPFVPAAVAVLLAHLVPSGLRIDVVSPLAQALVPPEPNKQQQSTQQSEKDGKKKGALASAEEEDAEAAGGHVKSHTHTHPHPHSSHHAHPHTHGGSGSSSAIASDAAANGAAAKALTLTPSEAVTLFSGVERWFGIPFARVAADVTAVQQWMDPPHLPGLALPPRNPFIPTDLSLKPPSVATVADGEGSSAGTGTASATAHAAAAAASGAETDEASGVLAKLMADGVVPPPPPHLTSVPVEVLNEVVIPVTSAQQVSQQLTPETPLLLVGRLWYKRDDAFDVPKTHFRSFIHTPCLYIPQPASTASASAGETTSSTAAVAATGTSSASSIATTAPPYPSLTSSLVLATLHSVAAYDDLNETLYMAECGKIDVSLRPHRHGYGLRIDGFSHKLPQVLQAVANRLTSPSCVGKGGGRGGGVESSEAATNGDAAGASASSSSSDGTSSADAAAASQFSRLSALMAREFANEILEPAAHSSHALQAALKTGGGIVGSRSGSATATSPSSAATSSAAAFSCGGSDVIALDPHLAAVEASLQLEARIALVGKDGSGITRQQLRAFSGDETADTASASSPPVQLWAPVPVAAGASSSSGGAVSASPVMSLSSSQQQLRPIILEVLVHGNETQESAIALYRALFAPLAAAVQRAYACAASPLSAPPSVSFATVPVPPSLRSSLLDAHYPPRSTGIIAPGADVSVIAPSVSASEANNVVEAYFQAIHIDDGDGNASAAGASSSAPAAAGAAAAKSAPLARRGSHAPLANAEARCGPLRIPPSGPPSFSYHVKRVQLKLLEELMTEPFFDSLRTKQQLGYTVSCSSRVSEGVAALHLLIVSSSHTTCDVISRLDEWIGSFRAKLLAMDSRSDDDTADEAEDVDATACKKAGSGGKKAPRGSSSSSADASSDDAGERGKPTPFQRHLLSLVEAKQQRDTSLAEETDRHWEEISSRRRSFNRLALEVAALQAFTSLEDIVALFDEVVRGPDAAVTAAAAAAAGSAPAAASGGSARSRARGSRAAAAAAAAAASTPASSAPASGNNSVCAPSARIGSSSRRRVTVEIVGRAGCDASKAAALAAGQ